MFYNYNDDYQYDSCVSKGICSIGPRTSSLQEVLIMYLKLLAFYTKELQDFGGVSKTSEEIILNTMSGLMYNLEYGNEQFHQTLIKLKSILIESKDTYLKICKTKNITPKSIKSNIKLSNNLDITHLIKQGEQEFSQKTEKLSSERKNLFEIMFFIIKSICINLVEIKSYNENTEIEKISYDEILILLNYLNYPDSDMANILKEIDVAVEIDNKLARELRQVKINHYGTPHPTDVSYSTRPNKAILVAGTNLRELEKILDFTKDKGLDIYTHGEMILAHMFPKFREYNHLIGQYGTGVENCLLDFATFPGAIFVAKHSLENIEYLYRGRLFTSDNFVPQGVIRIENDNFTKLVESSLNAKGFKRGKQRESVIIGYSLEDISQKLESFLQKVDKYKHVIFIGPESYSHKNKIYFEHFLKLIPQDTYVITFSYNNEKENVLHLNVTSDFPLTYKILDKIDTTLKSKNIDTSLFISKCDKHTISNIINLKRLGINHMFLSKCAPITLNPTLTHLLDKIYNIKSITNPEDDLNQIISNS